MPGTVKFRHITNCFWFQLHHSAKYRPLPRLVRNSNKKVRLLARPKPDLNNWFVPPSPEHAHIMVSPQTIGIWQLNPPSLGNPATCETPSPRF